MKKYVIISMVTAIVLSVYFISCKKEKNINTGSGVKETELNQRDYSVHEIMYSEAKTFISDFVKQFPAEAAESGIGSGIHINDLAEADVPFEGDGGVIGYTCYNEEEGHSFVCFHKSSLNPDEWDNYNLTDDETVASPSQLLFYTSDANEPEDIGKFIEDESTSLVENDNLTAYGTIINYFEHFMNKYLINNENANAYPYGYFTNQTNDFANLLHQESDIKGIRCYFGLNSDKATNKIVLVIFAVDSQNKNIIGSENVEARMIERSWP